MEEAETIQDQRQREKQGEEEKRFEEDFQFFLQRTGPRLALR